MRIKELLTILVVSFVGNCGFSQMAPTEPLVMKCLCKCVQNWTPSVILVSAETLNLPADTRRVDIAYESPRACRNHCQATTGNSASHAGVCWENWLKDAIPWSQTQEEE